MWADWSPVDRTIMGPFENALVTHAKGMDEFYITWERDSAKLLALAQWLTDELSEPDFIQPFKPNQALVGAVVAAAHIGSGYVQRARVLAVNSDLSTVTVQYLDVGDTDEIDILKISPMHQDLVTIPPFALKCKLGSVPYLDQDLEHDGIRADFLWEAQGSNKLFSCKLVGQVMSGDRFMVHLKLIVGPGAPLDINRFMLGKVNARRREEADKARAKAQSDFAACVLYPTSETDIPAFSSLKMKGLKIIRVTEVISPSDFSIEYVTDYYGLPINGPEWSESIQSFYRDPVNIHRHKLATCRPLIERCYVVDTGPGYGWQRCKVIRREDEMNIAEVLLVDLGIIRKFGFGYFAELEPQFATICALGFRAYLADVIPPKGSPYWSNESVEAFRNMVNGKWFHGIVIEHDQQPGFLPKFPQMNYRLGFVLVEKKNQGATKLTLNAEFCLRKFGGADGLAAGSTLMTSDDHEPVFDFEDVLVVLESLDDAAAANAKGRYNADEDAGSEGQGVTVDLESVNQLAILANPRKKLVSTKAWVESQDVKGTKYVYFKPMEESFPKNLFLMPQQIRNSMATGTISAILSPSCFYLQMANRFPELQRMTKCIEEEVGSTPEIDPSAILPGTPVAAILFDEKYVPTWYRGIVRAPHPNISLAKVILVDYGNEVACKYSAIRPLPEYFTTLPGFAHRFHLDVRGLLPTRPVPDLHPSYASWSADAVDFFRKYLTLWQGQKPIYYLWRHPGSPLIPLDAHGQEVVYSRESGFWMKHVTNEPTKGAELGPKLDITTTMLRNICTSVGVDIAYEKATDESTNYEFGRAWEVLVEKGVACFWEPA